MWGEREATIVVPPPACDSAVAPDSMAVQSSSIGIPCCRLPPSHPFSLSPYSQQQFSLWACSPIPMHQLPAPLHTCEQTSQSRACRAKVWTVCVFLTVLSVTDQPLHPLPTASNASLLSQSISPVERGFPHWGGGFPEFGNLSSASASLPWGAGPIPLPLLFLPSFFPSYPVIQGSL